MYYNFEYREYRNYLGLPLNPPRDSMFTASLAVLRHSTSRDLLSRNIDSVSCGVTRRSGALQLVVALGVLPWSTRRLVFPQGPL